MKLAEYATVIIEIAKQNEPAHNSVLQTDKQLNTTNNILVVTGLKCIYKMYPCNILTICT